MPGSVAATELGLAYGSTQPGFAHVRYIIAQFVVGSRYMNAAFAGSLGGSFAIAWRFLRQEPGVDAKNRPYRASVILASCHLAAPVCGRGGGLPLSIPIKDYHVLTSRSCGHRRGQMLCFSSWGPSVYGDIAMAV